LSLYLKEKTPQILQGIFPCVEYMGEFGRCKEGKVEKSLGPRIALGTPYYKYGIILFN